MPEFGPTAANAVTVAIKPSGPAPDSDTWATSNVRPSSACRESPATSQAVRKRDSGALQVQSHQDVLVEIAKSPAKDVDAARIGGSVIDPDLEPDRVVVRERELR